MTAIPSTPEQFRLRSVVVSAYGPTVLEAMGYGAAIPLVPLLARELGASVGTAAFVAGLMGIGQLVMSLPAGTFIARVGERRAMAIAAGVGTVAALAASRAAHLGVLAVTAVLTGMTWSIFLLARQGFMIDAVPAQLRARALSALGGSHRIGMFAGPILAAPVVGTFGVRAAFVFAAGMSLLALALVLRVPDLGESARAAARADPASTWAVLGRHRRALLTVGLGAAGLSGLRAARMSVLALWGDHLGLRPAQISLLVAVGALLEIAFFYPAGWAMDRRGRAFVAVPTATLLGAGLMLLPLTTGFTSMLLVTLFMAVGNGMGSGVVMTLGADTAPQLHRAKYLGGWRLLGDLGFAGGPVVLSVGSTLAGLAAASLATGAGGLAVAAWLAIWVGRLDRSRRAATGSSDEIIPA